MMVYAARASESQILLDRANFRASTPTCLRSHMAADALVLDMSAGAKAVSLIILGGQVRTTVCGSP